MGFGIHVEKIYIIIYRMDSTEADIYIIYIVFY